MFIFPAEGRKNFENNYLGPPYDFFPKFFCPLQKFFLVTPMVRDRHGTDPTRPKKVWFRFFKDFEFWYGRHRFLHGGTDAVKIFERKIFFGGFFGLSLELTQKVHFLRKILSFQGKIFLDPGLLYLWCKAHLVTRFWITFSLHANLFSWKIEIFRKIAYLMNFRKIALTSVKLLRFFPALLETELETLAIVMVKAIFLKTER